MQTPINKSLRIRYQGIMFPARRPLRSNKPRGCLPVE